MADALINNPYIQLAMGIMAGNTGANKGEALSNAIGGGLRSIYATEESARRQREEAAQQQIIDMKLAEYERMQNVNAQVQQHAAMLAEQGGPLADMYKAMAGINDASVATEFGKLVNTAKYNNAIAARMAGGGGGGGSAGMKFTPLSVNEKMFDYFGPMFEDKYGERWTNLPKHLQMEYIANFVNVNKQQGRSGKEYQMRFPELPQYVPKKSDGFIPWIFDQFKNGRNRPEATEE